MAPLYDVNKDGRLNAADVLSIVDYLNQRGSSGSAEGEPSSLAAIISSQWSDPHSAQVRSGAFQGDSSLQPVSGTSSYQQAIDDAMRTLAWQPQPLLARSGDQREDELDDSDELAELIDQMAADAEGWKQQ